MNLSRAGRAIQPETRHEGYRPFPNVPWRNAVQELIEVPLLVRLLSLPAGQRILEVGCGRGIALHALAKLCRPSYLVGLDIDNGLLAQAREGFDNSDIQVELVKGDARAVPLPDESVDIVIDFGTCYHITHPEMALGEIARVLSVGGMFVCETPVSQLLAHPARWSFRRRLPWHAAPLLIPQRNSVLWSSWVKK